MKSKSENAEDLNEATIDENMETCMPQDSFEAENKISHENLKANEKEAKPGKKTEATLTKVVFEEIVEMSMIQHFLSVVAHIFQMTINRNVPQHNWCSH